jgi:hypothetical protein
MRKAEKHRLELLPLFQRFLTSSDAVPLRQYLLRHSALPGRRANLELAEAFGDAVEEMAQMHAQVLWLLCCELTCINVESAPVNEPREFLPFCGAIGIGALGATCPDLVTQALDRLQVLAGDPRWRMREAVCFGLQRMLLSRFEAVMGKLERWVQAGSPLELRAAAVAVAHPPLLKRREVAERALKLHASIFDHLVRTPPTERREDAFRVLRKGLAFTLSVVVAAQPDEGFALLHTLASVGDSDVHWVLRQNLKKRRLSKAHPERVQAVNDRMRQRT